MASLPSAATILLAVSLMKDVEGTVTLSVSGGTGIPNQQALTLRCNYTVTSRDVVTSFAWQRLEGNSGVIIVTGSVNPKRAIFLDSWQNKGVFVGNYTSSLDIQLPASHVTSSYAGTYMCQVSGLSNTGQLRVTASVLDLPSISGLPPVQIVKEFSNLSVDCSTYTTPGNPPTTSYTWTYGDSTISTGTVLDRISISRSQGGNYTCTASNTQGSDSASVNVHVQYPPDQQNLECTSEGVIAGATVGGMLLTLLIGGIVLMVLYRKGYRIRNIQKENGSPKSTTNPDTVELDNRGYSSLDLINSPAQHSHVEEGSEKQQYSQLKIYENTKADAAADTSTYEGMTETPPVTYESIRASPYQNTGEHSQGPGHGNE